MGTPIFERTKHRQLWDWLANNPGNYTTDLVPAKWAVAWGCLYDDAFPDNYRCGNCPLEWPHNKGCSSTASLYHRWADAVYGMDRHSVETLEAVSLARQIRDLPVNPSVKWR